VRLFTHDRKMDALKAAPLFDGLSRAELLQLSRVSEDLEVPAGRVLCREGEIGHEFFVIIDGEVEVTRHGERVDTGRSGDFFGEIALIEEIPRMATVTATTPLRFFVLRRQDFHHLLETSPRVERKVLRALARRVVNLSTDPTVS
jgi:CRP-like cAMP-binding protein